MTFAEQAQKIVARYHAGAGLHPRDAVEHQLKIIFERSGKTLESILFDLTREIILARQKQATPLK